MLRGTKRSGWAWLLLFTSASTLTCCALPILLVSIGMGAVSAAMFSNFPFLVDLATNKDWLFAGSGLVLALAGFALFWPGRTCPTDPAFAADCEAALRWNKKLFAASLGIWSVGFFSAYLFLPILTLYERILGA